MSIDLPVFQLTANTDQPSSQITAELNNLRTIITRLFYNQLTHEQQIFFHSFCWDTLHGLATHTSPAVRLAASSVLGNILLRLGPYYFNDFIKSLCESIKKSDEESYIYLSAFCYLSKFISPSSLIKILKNIPIINLFGKASSEHLPNLIQQLRHFPPEFLKAITRNFLKLAVTMPTNRHLPKAAAIVISKDIKEFSGIVNTDLPLLLISQIFPDTFPELEPEIAAGIMHKAIDTITADSSLPTNYEAACRVLSQLLITRQIDVKDIKPILTEEIVKKSTNLTALMILPIDEDIVQNLFMDTKGADFADLELDRSKVNPLMMYFSKNLKFANQLLTLLSKNISPTSDSYSFALQILGDVAPHFPSNILNDILMKAFSINTPNWIHKLWTLELINRLKFTSLTQPVSDKAFEVIEISATSKTDKLTQTAREVAIKIFDTCNIDVFKLFIDKFIRNIDIFDHANFELRVSFLSYIFRFTANNNWTISFIHLGTILTEATTLFEFSATVMMDVFYIIGILAQNLKEDFQLLLYFTRKGLDIIEPSYMEFCGEPVGKDRPPLFESLAQPKGGQLNRVDTDLASNPAAWHTDIIHSAEAAFYMIVKVPWAGLEMKGDEIHYLFFIACRLLHLFPSSSNMLITMLMDHGILTDAEISKFIENSLKVSTTEDSILTLARVIALCMEQFDGFSYARFEVQDYISAMQILIPQYSGLDYSQVVSAKRALQLANITLSDETALKIIAKNQRYLLTDQPEVFEEHEDDNIIDPSILYTMSDDDTPDTTEIVDDSPLSTSPGLLLYCQSLSPFFSRHQEIPPELLKPALLKSFFNFSTVKINHDEAEFLLNYCLEHTNSQCTYQFIRYLAKNNIRINIASHLNHPFFQTKYLLSLVTSYARIKKLPNDYVNSVMKTNDIVDFVLNASTDFARKQSIALLKADPMFFMQRFAKIEKFTYAQIYNICIYVSTVKFPTEEFFVFAVSLISHNIESRKKKNLVRRLLTLFVNANISNDDVVQKAISLLLCDVGPISNIETVRKMNEAQIIELYFETFIIRNTANCAPMIETLSLVLTKSTFYGMTMHLHLNQPSADTVAQLLAWPLPSLATLPYRYYSDIYASNNKELLKPTISKNVKPPQTAKSSQQAKPPQNAKPTQSAKPPQTAANSINSANNKNINRTNKTNNTNNPNTNNGGNGTNNNGNVNVRDSNSNINNNNNSNNTSGNNNSNSNSNNNSNNNESGNMSAVVSPQITDALLNATFTRNYYVEMTVNQFIICLLKNRDLTRHHARDAFKYVNSSIEFHANSSLNWQLLQVYKLYIPFIKKDLGDIDIIKAKVGSLFECEVVPVAACEVVESIAHALKDAAYASAVIGTYLDKFDSYQSYAISESATHFKVKTTLNISSATDIIFFAKSFFATFNALITAKKHRKNLSNKILIGLFTKRHEKSIVMLSDPKSKPFAPFFALMGDEKDPPPAELVTYINNNRGDPMQAPAANFVLPQNEGRFNIF